MAGLTARPIRRDPASTTVTAQPADAAVLATSRPRNPPPTTTTERAPGKAARNRMASSVPRNANTPVKPAPGTGNGRLRAPVAKISVS